VTLPFKVKLMKLYNPKRFIQLTGWRAEWIELSLCSWEVAGSNPGRAKPKFFELVLVVFSLHAQEDKTRIEWPDVFIM